MNLFRSEEHVHNWSQFNPDSTQGLLPLDQEITVFSTEAIKRRLDGDFIARWLPLLADQNAEALRRLGKTGPFWQ